MMVGKEGVCVGVLCPVLADTVRVNERAVAQLREGTSIAIVCSL